LLLLLALSGFVLDARSLVQLALFALVLLAQREPARAVRRAPAGECKAPALTH
jgi:hypothetical protein